MHTEHNFFNVKKAEWSHFPRHPKIIELEITQKAYTDNEEKITKIFLYAIDTDTEQPQITKK